MKKIFLFVSILLLSFVSSAFALWDATLNWIPPTQFADGTPLNPVTDIKGYRICYSTTTAGDCSKFIDVGNITSYTMTGITVKKLFYTVRTIDQDGDMSIDSNEIWRKVRINPATLTKNSCTATIICGPK